MKRWREGLPGGSFFQKQAPKGMPSWIPTRQFRTWPREGESRLVDFPLVNSADALLWMVQMHCIDMNCWYSRVDKPERPDFVVFDLDPPDEHRFTDVKHLALRLRELLEDELGLTAFVKTTGGKGVHVHVPLSARDDFDAARGFARRASEVLAAREPDRLTVEQRKDGRGDRVYSDVMRNAYAQTVVAPYTVRARPGARVATPLSWEELKEPGLTPGRFTLRTIGERLDQLGRSDPWAGLTRHRYGLARATQRLVKLAAREL